jgi:hypothetical protein
MKNNVAVFGDLTALFQIRKVIKANINYYQIDKAIKKHFNVEQFTTNKFYTLFVPENEGQVKFVAGLEKNLGWKIETKRPSEIRRIVDSDDHKGELNALSHRQYRFDSEIAYDLAEATAEDEIDTVVVISDSLELLNPLKRCQSWIKNVNLAFFGSTLDQRWWKHLDNNGEVKFLDLTDLMYRNVSNDESEELSRFE